MTCKQQHCFSEQLTPLALSVSFCLTLCLSLSLSHAHTHTQIYNICNRVYCIHVPGHDPLLFSFLSFILFDWVGVLWPQLSKVLKPVCWACSIPIVQELCESRGGRPGLSVLTSLLVSMDVKIYWTVLRHWSQLVPNMSNDIWGH